MEGRLAADHGGPFCDGGGARQICSWASHLARSRPTLTSAAVTRRPLTTDSTTGMAHIICADIIPAYSEKSSSWSAAASKNAATSRASSADNKMFRLIRICRQTRASAPCFILVDDIHDRAPRRPDEQFTNAVLGSVGVFLDGLVERDAVNREIRMSCGDPARYIKPGCRVRVFLAIERV